MPDYTLYPQINQLRLTGYTYAAISAKFGISMNAVFRIANVPMSILEQERERSFHTEEDYTQSWHTRPRKPCPMPHVMPGIPLSRLMAGR